MLQQNLKLYFRGKPRPEIFPLEKSFEGNEGKNRKEPEGKSYVSTIDSRYGQWWSTETYVLSKKGEGRKKEIASCLHAGGHSGGNHSDMDYVVVAQRGRGEGNTQTIEARNDGLTNSLTSVEKDNMIISRSHGFNDGGIKNFPNIRSSTNHNEMVIQMEQFDTSGKGYKSQQDRVYHREWLMCSLPSQRAENKVNIFDGASIRRLTPLECERLQGFKDGWTEGISDTQRYKCLGNAVTVNVVEEIVKKFTSQTSTAETQS